MALLKKKNNKVTQRKKENPKFENSVELKKLTLFITIIDNGYSKDIEYIFKKFNCGLQFVELGKGTASKAVYDLLGAIDSNKEVVFSVVREEYVPDIKKELDICFIMNKKKFRGISMAIDLESIVSVSAYTYLANM